MNKGISVLFIAHWWPNDLQKGRGLFVQKHAELIAELEEVERLEVMAIHILPSAKTLRIEEKREDLEHYRLRHFYIYSSLHKLIYLSPKLQFKLLKKRLNLNSMSKDFQLIHSNVLHPSLAFAALLNQKLALPIVHSEHWSKVGKYLSNHPKFFKRKKELKAIHFVSTFLEDMVKSNLPKRIQRFVIPNVVEVAAHIEGERKENSFLSVAQDKSPKRVDLIAEALIAQANKNLDETIHWTHVGANSVEHYLKGKPSNLQVNCIEFLPHKKLQEQYQSHKYFLHASEIETFSVVVAEALSSGCKVLASNTGAIPSFQEYCKNLVVCSNNLADWQQGLQELKDMKLKEIATLNEYLASENIKQSFLRMYKSALS